VAAGLTLTADATAQAATGDTVCPSSSCLSVAQGLGEPLTAVPDGHGSAYVPFQTGELRKVDLTSGVSTSVATGLGNLRGAALDGKGSAYVTNFDGALVKVDLATGAHTTLAGGLGSLFAVARSTDSTYVTDAQGDLIQVKDGQSPHVVSNDIGFSEGIALDGGGSAYTADMMTGRILRTDLSTGATTTLSNENYEPQSISIGPDGLVYFEVGDEVIRLDPATGQTSHVTNIVGLNSGTFTTTANGDAYAVAYNSNGSIWKIAGLAGPH